jgi:hypothetical protein
MSDQTATVMTFASMDEAESALDWIGIEFSDGDACFEGVLVADDAEILDAVLADPETPGPVRALATALREVLTAASPGADAAGDEAGGTAYRVAFTA